MRKAGGVLTIIGGSIGIVIGIIVIIRIVTGAFFMGGKDEAMLIPFTIVALIVGIIALIGGFYALDARVWSFALAGGIVLISIGAVIIGPFIGMFGEELVLGMSFAPFLILGITSTIFIALRRIEFE